MMREKTKCRTCGQGLVPLSASHQETLDYLRKNGDSTAMEIWQARKEKNIAITAINNRLEKLRELKLVDRKKKGKAWVYTALPF
jgi:predicted transcriptional regulator